MEKNSKLYQDLFKLFKCAHPSQTPAKAQIEFNQTWKQKIKPADVYKRK